MLFGLGPYPAALEGRKFGLTPKALVGRKSGVEVE
jgi:hypothetical protein